MAQLGKTGVLLINLGTPDEPSRGAVYRYLKEFLLDKRVIDTSWLSRQLLVRGIIAPFRSGKSAKLYQLLWTENGSPLKYYGELLAKGVQEQLGEDYVVALGMRYQQPSIETALKELFAAQVSQIIMLPLFPQYASASTGSAKEEALRVISQREAIPAIKTINSFHDEPGMIKVFADNARQFDIGSYDHILFSYHGLPQRQLRKADDCNHCLQKEDCCQSISDINQFCYSAQCHDTTRALVAELGLEPGSYTTCFQSRLGSDPWVQPYTTDALKEQASRGSKRLLVFSPAFVADCLETIVEISDEYQEEFEEMGGETVDLVPSLNDNPQWIDTVVEMIRREE